MQLRSNIGEALVKISRTNGWTSKEVANELGVDATAYSQIINGKRKPNEAFLTGLRANPLDLSPDIHAKIVFLAELAARISFHPQNRAEWDLYLKFENDLVALRNIKEQKSETNILAHSRRQA